MPYVSLGHPDDNSSEVASLALWLRLGGVGIDTALVYKNQKQVAEGLAQSGKARDEVFITTKIPCFPAMTPALALDLVRFDLSELRVSYVDLMLLHEPCKAEEDTQQAWLGLQQAFDAGLARAIGVSNFARSDIDAVVKLGSPQPAVNQCRMSVGDHDDATRAYGEALGITYEAFSPLRHVDLSDPRLLQIARAHRKSAAQVALRWIVQQDVVLATSPGAVASFAQADLELDSFALSSDEMATLSAMAAQRASR